MEWSNVKSVDSGVMDVVGFDVVTVGEEISKLERQKFAAGDFQDYRFADAWAVFGRAQT